VTGVIYCFCRKAGQRGCAAKGASCTKISALALAGAVSFGLKGTSVENMLDTSSGKIYSRCKEYNECKGANYGFGKDIN
jgi:hypothetical protein